MNKVKATQEQRAQLIEKLRAEYNELNGKIARLNAFLNDIEFIKKVPDIIEQELMKGQLRAMENYLSNLRGRIMFQEAQQKAEKSLNDWMSMKGKVVNTPSGPVRLVNTDEQHHCGQDADDACCQARNSKPSPATISVQDPNESQPVDLPVSVKDLLGMQVVSVGNQPCDGCPSDNYGDKCVKIEAVGGIYICLAKPEQEEPKRPVISFDDDNEESPDNIMARIKEKADDFMDYLDSVVKG